MIDNNKYPINPVLIIDNDNSFIYQIEKDLRAKAITHINVCTDGSILKNPEIEYYSFILLNISIPGIDGKAAASKILDDYPKIPVILIMMEESLTDAVKFMKQGALYFYQKKKIDYSKLIEQICRGIKLYESIKPIITRSKRMRPVFQDIGRVSQNDTAVLLRGETGVGKELVADAIHLMSGRKGKFIKINIASFDDTLFSNTLFGHVKGAFDGANIDRNGLIEEARGGTIFMDEIGDLRTDSQEKLLRLLQYGTYYKLGSYKEIQADTKIIAATNRNIEDDIREGKFREDFFYRFRGFTISIPPLRQRREDIRPLVEHFIGMAVEKYKLNKPLPSLEFIEKIEDRYFKCNIRELEELIHKLILYYRGHKELTPKMLNDLEENSEKSPTHPAFKSVDNGMPAKYIPTFIEVEASYYRELLSRSGNDETKAARWADLERRTFNNRLQAIKDKLKMNGKNFDDIPRLTKLVELFPPAHD